MLLSPPSKDWLMTSWGRSHQAGLEQKTSPEHRRLELAQLSARKEKAEILIHAVEKCALPLFNQVFLHCDSRLILTDHEGVILTSWGLPRFKEKLNEIALSSGSFWTEEIKGTNAIGTALIEQRAVTIIGDEHYIHQHQFISCSASPIFDHSGQLLGILDITSEQHQHDLSTQMLVQNMVQLVENHLLNHIPSSTTRIHLALDETLLKTGWQGVVIADDDGRIIASNHIANQLLHQSSVVGLSIEMIYEDNQSHLVFEEYCLKNKRRSVSSKQPIFHESSQLHYGDQQIERAWQQAQKLINNDIPILILGETGVGKNEFVKALHQQSVRNQNPLVTVNCGAIPKDLIESELFGYEAGAFTGASSKGFKGKIRQADKGILFLDEIADMPLDAQCRLLHVLQDKTVVPVGSAQPEQIDIQVIAATHKDLPSLVEQGVFRQDLYYRLNGLVVSLPSLKDRQDKQTLIAQIHAKYRLKSQTLSPELLDALCQYSWPGNIRELDNMMKVSCLLASDEPELYLHHVPGHLVKEIHQHRSTRDVNDLQTTIEHELEKTYRETGGNISKMARLLGISRNTIYRKLKVLGIHS
ncbi:sigma-54-dependent Fis family transcriptional regulator [Vibrio viridaestus]|uniref:Sigma-54-dependent Fis family transcriptional regulator n=1 Tax=Vibrio viridaestus TaxID=2487322 RepID=A0A3N9U3S4_9VIBR|nr:sigma-54-dependent Fis family transcriptional regulator [Vibrio viridaestus]RQW62676.1 sigma-54-dependent Fis family transcriptional regulator [Vibrio viridaestus]